MSERKVLNKYFPPDFDPSKVPRMRKPKDRQEQIRLMAPFSMRCNSCGEYIYAGKKFNGRKETVQGETYYGIKIFRFYIKCPVCSSEITFKTDPKNADYTVEHGVSRNFEPWREGKEEDDKDGKNADPLAHLIEEEGLGGSDDEDEDPMKALEKRQQEAKREMEVMDALQDIRTRNARIDRMNPDDVLQSRVEKGKERETTEQQRIEQEEDDALVRKYFSRDLATARPVDKADEESDNASEAQSSVGPGIDSKLASERTIKRARPFGLDDDKDDLDREPDVMTLLKARQDQLPPDTSSFTSSSSSAVKAGPNKRKKGTSAFGVVRKKVA